MGLKKKRFKEIVFKFKSLDYISVLKENREMVESNLKKEECSLVILGHSNVGKSSLCGSILLALGLVEPREI